MKYIIRALKYYAYLAIVLCLVLFVLAKLSIVDGNPGTMFVNGYDSLWQIAVFIGIFAALYPKFGYSGREARALGDNTETLPALMTVMEDHGYTLEDEDGETMIFRKRSPAARVLKMWEDRVTVKRTMSGYEFEGITKDIVRLVSAVEYKLREPGE